MRNYFKDHPAGACLAGLAIAALVFSTALSMQGAPASYLSQAGPQAGTVDTAVLADPQDPYYPLAVEMAQAENAFLAHSPAEALKREPASLLWVVSPMSLNDRVLANFGISLRQSAHYVSVGLITGGTMEKARALWLRKKPAGGPLVAVVVRENKIEIAGGGPTRQKTLSKENFLSAMQHAGYLDFAGHGAKGFWGISEDTQLTARDIPLLPALFANADACQTLRVWGEGSIALAFVDSGAAGYAGFVHSPYGYLFGEPKDFPMRYTWPDFPIGHAIQIQNSGLLKGFHDWPFYFLLGDPRLSFQQKQPYEIASDEINGSARVLTLKNTPAGVIPVKITGGRSYSFVEVERVGKAWERELVYNAAIQMVNIKNDKFLLIAQRGGDFTIRLWEKAPFYWPITSSLQMAMDHATVIYHSEGNMAAGNILTVILLLAIAIIIWRKKIPLTARYIWASLAVGLLFALARGGYAWLRQEELVQLYAQYLRTVDNGYDINWLFIVTSFLVAAAGAFMWLNVKKWPAKAAILLVITTPGWLISLFCLAVISFVNILANQRWGFSIYGYGQTLLFAAAFLAESALAGFLLLLAEKFLGSGRLKKS
jgi:hypothetical protein